MKIKNKAKTIAFIIFVVGIFAIAISVIACAAIDYFDEQIYMLNVMDRPHEGYE